MRIAFLFNHDQIHQVAHGLPIAIALAKRRIGSEIIVCSTNDRTTSELRRLGGDAFAHDLQLVELKLSTRSSRIADAVAGGIIPSAKLLIYRDNLEFFKTLDILIVPEKASLILKDRFHLDQLKIIHTRHGAGDRAIGFDAASSRFDHVLAAGPKIRDRLIRDAGVPSEKISVVGYPKFDLFAPAAYTVRPRNIRPVVLYNPHVAPHLSSWYGQGRAIMQWFAVNPDYQLIFAPHIMLFERRVVVTIQPPGIGFPGRIPQRFREVGNIFIDAHSRALTTMEYLNRADIYLGDASSQVYEFLVEPRPCVFFNAHGVEWEKDPNFAHWHAGRVITDVAELGTALSSASTDHQSRFGAAQREMLRYTFDVAVTPSSARAAEVIARIAGEPSSRRAKRTSQSKSFLEPQDVPALAAS